MDSDNSTHVEILIGGEHAEEVMRSKAESKRCACKFEHPFISRCFESCWIFNIVVLVVGIIAIGLIAAKVLGGL